MRNILRRPRTVVVATALAGSLVLGMAAAAHADFNSPHDSASAPSAPSATATESTESTESTEAAEAATCSTTYLSLGSTGTCVRLLQKNLGGLSVSGVYGSATQSRVRSFQDDTTGLTVDGKVGPQTWQKLRKFGKAIGWLSGVTVYMCKASSTRFQYSAWNNSGKNAWWYLSTSEISVDGSALWDDDVRIQGTIAAGPYDSELLVVRLSSENQQSTTDVRDFSRNTLPACG